MSNNSDKTHLQKKVNTYYIHHATTLLANLSFISMEIIINKGANDQ